MVNCLVMNYLSELPGDELPDSELSGDGLPDGELLGCELSGDELLDGELSGSEFQFSQRILAGELLLQNCQNNILEHHNN